MACKLCRAMSPTLNGCRGHEEACKCLQTGAPTSASRCWLPSDRDLRRSGMLLHMPHLSRNGMQRVRMRLISSYSMHAERAPFCSTPTWRAQTLQRPRGRFDPPRHSTPLSLLYGLLRMVVNVFPIAWRALACHTRSEWRKQHSAYNANYQALSNSKSARRRFQTLCTTYFDITMDFAVQQTIELAVVRAAERQASVPLPRREADCDSGFFCHADLRIVCAGTLLHALV